MIFTYIFLDVLIFLCIQTLDYIVVDGVILSSVVDSPEGGIYRLYLSEWSKDSPSDLDPAITSPSNRLQLCEEITNSGIFAKYGYHPVNMEEILLKMEQPRYSNILNRIFSPAVSPTSLSSYTNYLLPQDFKIFMSPPSVSFKEEFVFACLLRLADSDRTIIDGEESDQIVTFYVSKAYNIIRGQYTHRFLFPEKDTFCSDTMRQNTAAYCPHILLVEGSAEVYERPDFNVELHYLELKKHHKLAASCREDPVCRLNLGDPHYRGTIRLCTTILTSSNFKNKIGYPHQVQYNGWFVERVAFRIEKGIEVSNIENYYELMLRCFAQSLDNNLDVKTFYVSRGYNPNQVFVYIKDESNLKFYIDSLITNVGIVYEKYNFGNVEI